MVPSTVHTSALNPAETAPGASNAEPAVTFAAAAAGDAGLPKLLPALEAPAGKMAKAAEEEQHRRACKATPQAFGCNSSAGAAVSAFPNVLNPRSRLASGLEVAATAAPVFAAPACMGAAAATVGRSKRMTTSWPAPLGFKSFPGSGVAGSAVSTLRTMAVPKLDNGSWGHAQRDTSTRAAAEQGNNILLPMSALPGGWQASGTPYLPSPAPAPASRLSAASGASASAPAPDATTTHRSSHGEALGEAVGQGMMGASWTWQAGGGKSSSHANFKGKAGMAPKDSCLR